MPLIQACNIVVAYSCMGSPSERSQKPTWLAEEIEEKYCGPEEQSSQKSASGSSQKPALGCGCGKCTHLHRELILGLKFSVFRPIFVAF